MTRFWNSGDWGLIPNSKIARIVSDLCSAINERQRIFSPFWRSEPSGAPDAEDLIRNEFFRYRAAESSTDITMTPHEWTLYDHAPKAFPRPSDFALIPFGSDYWRDIVEEIRGQIESLFCVGNRYRFGFLRRWENPPGQQDDYDQYSLNLWYVWMYEVAAPDPEANTPGQYAPILDVANLLESGTLEEDDWLDFETVEDSRIWTQLREAVERAYMAQYHPIEVLDSVDDDAALNLATAGDLLIDGVAERETLVLNGVLFTAWSSEVIEDRKFDATSDNSAVASIADIINDGVHGVPGLTATSSVSSPGNPAQVEVTAATGTYIWPKGLAASMSFINTVQERIPKPDSTMEQYSGSVQSSGSATTAMNQAYGIAVNDPSFEIADSNPTLQLAQIQEQATGISPDGAGGDVDIRHRGSRLAIKTGTVPGTVLQGHLSTFANYPSEVSAGQPLIPTVLSAMQAEIQMGSDVFVTDIPERTSAMIGTGNDPHTDPELTRRNFDSLNWPAEFPFQAMPVSRFLLPATNPLHPSTNPTAQQWTGWLNHNVQQIDFGEAPPVGEDFANQTYTVIEFTDLSGLQWY